MPKAIRSGDDESWGSFGGVRDVPWWRIGEDLVAGSLPFEVINAVLQPLAFGSVVNPPLMHGDGEGAGDVFELGVGWPCSLEDVCHRRLWDSADS